MERPLIYLDANVVIRLVEGDAAALAPLAARLAPSLGVPRSLVTSRLTRLECRSKPMRAGDLAILSQYDVFFAGVELVLSEVSQAVVERATELRARYTLKTPDALHYATAVEAGAAVFLTGDRGPGTVHRGRGRGVVSLRLSPTGSPGGTACEPVAIGRENLGRLAERARRSKNVLNRHQLLTELRT